MPPWLTILTAWYRIGIRPIWNSAGRCAGKKGDAGQSAGKGAGKGTFIGKMPCQHLCQHPLFRQHPCQHSCQHFSGSPPIQILYQVIRTVHQWKARLNNVRNKHKIILPLWSLLKVAPHIHFISSKNHDNGDPEALQSGWAGSSRKFRVSVEFHPTKYTKARSEDFQDIRFADPVRVFWEVFDWAGRGEFLPYSKG